MPYATLSDMIDQFGEREVIAITDRAFTGAADATVAASALQKAGDEIDSYLAARYPLPLSVVPRRLTEIACDLARYKLSGASVTETDIVRLRYKDAIKDLERVRDGKIDLGLSVAGTPPVESAQVKVIGGSRVFTRETLGDY